MISYGNCILSLVNLRIPIFCAVTLRKLPILSFSLFSTDSRKAGDAGKWFTRGEIMEMSRRALQKWCKKLGIRANTTTVQMRAELLDFHENVLLKSDILNYPFLPMENCQSLPGQSSYIGYKTSSYVRQDKFLLNNFTVNLSTDQGTRQVRHFQNIPSLVDQDVFSSIDVEASNLSRKMRLPSVSKILKNTAPKSKLFAISQWTKKQKQLLGNDIFQQKMNEIRNNGLDFHHFVHQCLVNRQLNTAIPEKLYGYLASAKEVFDKMTDAMVSEMNVCHTHLGYQGKLDTLACYNGNPCIIEWKTSQRRRSSLADCGEYPIQLVAYAGAINSNPSSKIQIQQSLLVIAYEDGSPADVHLLDFKQCRHFWQDWLVRLHKFKNN